MEDTKKVPCSFKNHGLIRIHVKQDFTVLYSTMILFCMNDYVPRRTGLSHDYYFCSSRKMIKADVPAVIDLRGTSE